MDFETALEYCRNTIGNTTAFTACSEVPNVPTEDALEICALDITVRFLKNNVDFSFHL